MEVVLEEQQSNNLVYREHIGRGHEALPDAEFHYDVPDASSKSKTCEETRARASNSAVFLAFYP